MTALTTGSAEIAALLNNGNGTFAAPVNFSTGTFPVDIAQGDLAGDGDLDIATASSPADDVSVLLNND